MKRYVIIGNGVAAVGCLEGIRSVDPAGEIAVISKEAHKVYSRPLISYYLEGKTDTTRMNYRAENFYEANKATLYLGKTAEAIDPKKKTVVLDDRTVLPYDALCVATGSRPFVPPMEGLETVEKKFSFMTLDDALALEKVLTKDARVLIVGAGLIGLKCAEGIAERVAKITVCDLADHILSSILDAECAALVQKQLEQHNVEFLLGDSVAKFERNKAAFKSGKTVDFDILVLAVGVRANAELVKTAGGETNRGILIDDAMQTSLAKVYAAGDCTEGYDASIGARRVLAILPNAYLQGQTAGVNMAGGKAIFDNAIPMNSIGFFGLHVMTAGAYEGEMIEEKADGEIKRLFVKENRLRGFILIGTNERAGIYTSLVRERTPLDSIDFAFAQKRATNLIFSKEVRKEKFGGAL